MSAEENRPTKMIGDPEGAAVEFYRRAAAGTLSIQHCASCARAQHPPRYRCPACGSNEFRWPVSSGRGRVFSWVLTHRPMDPAWAADGLPYVSVVVEMEEGVRVVGGLRGMDPADLRLDLPVVLEVEPAGEEFAFFYFSPAGSGLAS